MSLLRTEAVARTRVGRVLLNVLVFAGLYALALLAAAYALAVLAAPTAWTANVAAAAPPQVELLRAHAADSDHVLVRIAPPSVAPGAPAREVVLVLDTSRAMAGPALEQAKAALRLALNGLKPADRFNIISFSDEPRPLFNTPRDASAANVAAARRIVAGLRAGGAADPVSALKAALSHAAPGESRPRQVVLVTGSAIDAPGRLIAEAANRGRARLYLVGIGRLSDNGALRRAAELGGGGALAIRRASDVLRGLRGLFARLERPVITQLQAHWPSGVRADAMPHPLPDSLAGEPLVLVAKLSSLKGDLLITGQVGGGPWEARLRLADARPTPGVAQLWARRKIAALEARRYAGQHAAAVAAVVQEVAFAYGLEGAAGARHGGAPIGGFDAAGGAGVRPAAHAGDDELAMAPFGRSAPAGAGAFAAYRVLIGDRMAAIVFLVLTFAGMSALTLSFWRHLRREYASSRRTGWRI